MAEYVLSFERSNDPRLLIGMNKCSQFTTCIDWPLVASFGENLEYILAGVIWQNAKHASWAAIDCNSTHNTDGSFKWTFGSDNLDYVSKKMLHVGPPELLVERIFTTAIRKKSDIVTLIYLKENLYRSNQVSSSYFFGDSGKLIESTLNPQQIEILKELGIAGLRQIQALRRSSSVGSLVVDLASRNATTAVELPINKLAVFIWENIIQPILSNLFLPLDLVGIVSKINWFGIFMFDPRQSSFEERQSFYLKQVSFFTLRLFSAVPGILLTTFMDIDRTKAAVFFGLIALSFMMGKLLSMFDILQAPNHLGVKICTKVERVACFCLDGIMDHLNQYYDEFLIELLRFRSQE